MKDIKEQFKVRADSFDSSARWVQDKGLLDIHQRLAGVSPGDLVLEVCCGTGIVGEKLLSHGAKVIGVDISPSMLANAKKRLSFCINGQAEKLPFLSNTFDVVICRQALHFLDTFEVIKEIFRVAKPKRGRIIISQIVPYGEDDKDWLKKIHSKKQPLLKNFLEEEDLITLLKTAGCKDIVLDEYFVEEPITNWLTDTFFPKKERESIRNMFLNAPEGYKALHQTKVVDGDIFDTMRWVIVKGRKP